MDIGFSALLMRLDSADVARSNRGRWPLGDQSNNPLPGVVVGARRMTIIDVYFIHGGQDSKWHPSVSLLMDEAKRKPNHLGSP